MIMLYLLLQESYYDRFYERPPVRGGFDDDRDYERRFPPPLPPPPMGRDMLPPRSRGGDYLPPPSMSRPRDPPMGLGSRGFDRPDYMFSRRSPPLSKPPYG